jgi:hypothetical protein
MEVGDTMKDFLQIALTYSHNPASFLIFLIALAISLIMVAALVMSVAAFTCMQVLNIFRLYGGMKTEDLSNFHPYTRSILENRCPEMKRIQQLKALPRTNYTRMEMRNVVQSMIDTLEAHESQPVKYSLISKLKAL